METISFDQDISVLYVPAKSFPGGIQDAQQRLHAMIPFSSARKYFGISRPENGVIQYKAAAEELQEGEAAALHCDTLLLKKGNYISLSVPDYTKDLSAIGKAFQQLLAQPGLDPEGYCVEWYLDDKDMKCMIRLEE